MSSFMDIKDRVKRKAVIKDYISTVKRLKRRYEDEKLGSLARQAELEEQWEPIVKSQDRVTEKITKELEPIKDEIVNLRESLEHQPQAGPSSSSSDDLGPRAKRFINRNKVQDPTLDRSFGIRYTIAQNGPVIGNTPITFRGDDIVIGNKVYIGTRGLWSLITDKYEKQIDQANPTDVDHEQYRDILLQTRVLYKNYNPNSGSPRSSVSWKWKEILQPVWNGIKRVAEKRQEDEGSTSSEDDYETGDEEGGSIIPGCLVFLKRNGACCCVKKKGKGLYLESSHDDIQAPPEDGLYIQTPSCNLYRGKGLRRKMPLLNVLA